MIMTGINRAITEVVTKYMAWGLKDILAIRVFKNELSYRLNCSKLEQSRNVAI